MSEIRVRIPTPLRQFSGGRAEVQVSATSVGDALGRVVDLHPELRRHLYAEDGSLRNFVNAYLNDEDVRQLDGGETSVSSDDVITILPSIAGGAPGDADDLSLEEIRRYSRHLIMPEVGMAGQRKLRAARVLMIGAGGLGSPVGLYLAAAGVGTLGVVDFDVVDETNLQRQLLHGTSDVGRSKLDSARDRLREANPFVRVEGHETRLDSANALDIIGRYDLVVDGTDNFPTRYLVNDACVLLGKPYVYGSIFRFEGQVSVFGAPDGPCYRCLFREPPPPGLVPSCAEGGVLGVLPGIVGALQAAEAIKWIIGGGEPLAGRLLLVDALEMRFRELKLRRDPGCPVCGDDPTVTELIDYEEFCGVPQAERAEAREMDGLPEVAAGELARRLLGGEEITIIDVREPHEWDIANLAPQGARLIPLGFLTERLSELSTADTIVVHCRSGQRSARAVRQLQDAGFRRVANLEGGILAWAEEVDPTIPTY
ncbi:MAG: molybdopterin-synthase adenylyltransferase MoeB [Gemmatimonadota bacterium]